MLANVHFNLKAITKCIHLCKLIQIVLDFFRFPILQIEELKIFDLHFSVWLAAWVIGMDP